MDRKEPSECGAYLYLYLIVDEDTALHGEIWYSIYIQRGYFKRGGQLGFRSIGDV
jgi:hypothetical protein